MISTKNNKLFQQSSWYINNNKCDNKTTELLEYNYQYNTSPGFIYGKHIIHLNPLSCTTLDNEQCEIFRVLHKRILFTWYYCVNSGYKAIPLNNLLLDFKHDSQLQHYYSTCVDGTKWTINFYTLTLEIKRQGYKSIYQIRKFPIWCDDCNYSTRFCHKHYRPFEIMVPHGCSPMSIYSQNELIELTHNINHNELSYVLNDLGKMNIGPNVHITKVYTVQNINRRNMFHFLLASEPNVNCTVLLYNRILDTKACVFHVLINGFYNGDMFTDTFKNVDFTKHQKGYMILILTPMYGINRSNTAIPIYMYLPVHVIRFKIGN